jgi:hypothetical protein
MIPGISRIAVGQRNPRDEWEDSCYGPVWLYCVLPKITTIQTHNAMSTMDILLQPSLGAGCSSTSVEMSVFVQCDYLYEQCSRHEQSRPCSFLIAPNLAYFNISFLQICSTSSITKVPQTKDRGYLPVDLNRVILSAVTNAISL